jgi:mono/diheme cytochrome c family protein
MKETRRTLVAIGAAVVLVLALKAGFGADPDRRGLELFPDMAHSLAAETYAAEPALPGGRAQQPLVPGVVVRGFEPFPNPPTPEGAAKAGAELANPFAATAAAALARGAQRYAIFCAVCHGADGQGRGPAVERGMLPPPSLLADRARALPDGHLFHVLTCGQGNMASYATQLSREDRWKTILHVRALQAAAPPAPAGGGR